MTERPRRAPAKKHAAHKQTVDDARDPKLRRALSSIAAPTSKRGAEPLASTLFHALEQAAVDDADTLTHGFHSYPARMHPSIAAVILDAVAGSRGASSPAPHVVDPFCGSGTVLIEARRRGLASTGTDINPVALRVARVKCDVRDEAARSAFTARLDDVVEKSKERVRARAEARAPLSKAVADRFEGHVLRELAGLYAEIEAVDDERDRKTLEVVLSAIVVKVSKQRADTDPRDIEGGRRIGRFIPTEIFHKKGQELVRRWAELATACPADSPEPQLFLEDARLLDRAIERPASAIITSPPYAGTYDYASHHALRVPWLNLPAASTSMKAEIGARRSLTGTDAVARWDAETKAMLRAIAASLDQGALAFLVVGDGEVRGQRIAADAHLEKVAPGAGLAVVAVASAPRPDWRRGADRLEHVVALGRA